MPFPNFPITAVQHGAFGSDLITEVFFRTGGRLPRSSGTGFDDMTTATSASPQSVGTSCIAYVNKAYALIEGAATYVWDVFQQNGLAVSGAGQLDLSNLTPFPLTQIPDIGANIEFTNTNGLPITRDPVEIALQGFPTQFVNINTALYNNWFLLHATSLGAEPGLVQFSPAVAGSVNMLYSRLPNYLTDGPYGNEPAVPWMSRYMDDLLIEFAEMMIKRILNFGGWQDSEQRCLKKLQDARTMYSAQRKDTGPIEEGQLAASGMA